MNKLSIANHEYNLKLWISRICDCRSSGKSVRDWCSDNGIGIKTYYYWMRKIKQEAFDSLPADRKVKVLDTVSSYPASSFAEFRLPDETVSSNLSSAVILHLNGATLEIHNGASDTVIESTLRVLKKLC
jgi:hypothetical protein